MEDPVKIPSPSRMQRLTELLTEDEDFRFPVIKLHRDKPRYELPAPTREDEDNIETASTFRAVVLVARKNYYQSDEDKEAGKDPKEKRALYVLRSGKITPELVYVNPTSVKNWKIFIKQCAQSENRFFAVLVEFSAERVKGKQYTWNKINFKSVRTLTEEEMEHVQEIRTMVDSRVKEYEDDSELDKYEDEALNEGKRKDRDEEPEEKHSRRASAKVEDDDDDDDKPAKSKSKTKEEPKSKSKSKAKDDDDDDEPKAKSKSKSKDDDDDDEPKSKSKSKKKDDDDDDDDEPKAKSKKKDDDDDDDEPKSKSKSKKKDDDDDDEPKSKSKGRAGYPNLDDDDDDD